MPFAKRKSDPVRISQVELGANGTIKDELEFVANHTLCHVISQLSDLNNLASDMFEDLTLEVVFIRDRSTKLRDHVNVLKEKYKSFNKKKPGESTNIFEEKHEQKLLQHFDQQVLRPISRSIAVTKIYETARQPPAFYKINPFRDDGRDGLTLYTDPDFFFRNWSSQMKRKETKHVRSHGREKRQKDEKAPRQIKRKQDLLQDRNAALGPEFDPNFTTDHNEKKRKRRKKKKMEGFSNKQYEKESKRNSNQSEALGTSIQYEANNDKTDTCKKTLVNGDEITCIPPSVPMRRIHEPEISPTVPMRNHAPLADNRDSLPLPPPPPIMENGDITNGEMIDHSLSILPPDPSEFYPRLNDLDLPLPPPPGFDDVRSERDSNVSNNSLQFPLPPMEQITTRRSNKQNRISSFISTDLLTNDNSRIHMPSPDYYDIAESPEWENNRNIPPAPGMPPPPPAPGMPPPPPALSMPPPPSVSIDPTNNGMAESQTHTGGLLFDNSSLLEMKKKLVSSQERTRPQIQPIQSDSLDVHSIMMKALEGHRKAKVDSSSDEELYTSDSDSDWE